MAEPVATPASDERAAGALLGVAPPPGRRDLRMLPAGQPLVRLGDALLARQRLLAIDAEDGGPRQVTEALGRNAFGRARLRVFCLERNEALSFAFPVPPLRVPEFVGLEAARSFCSQGLAFYELADAANDAAGNISLLRARYRAIELMVAAADRLLAAYQPHALLLPQSADWRLRALAARAAWRGLRVFAVGQRPAEQRWSIEECGAALCVEPAPAELERWSPELLPLAPSERLALDDLIGAPAAPPSGRRIGFFGREPGHGWDGAPALDARERAAVEWLSRQMGAEFEVVMVPARAREPPEERRRLIDSFAWGMTIDAWSGLELLGRGRNLMVIGRPFYGGRGFTCDLNPLQPLADQIQPERLAAGLDAAARERFGCFYYRLLEQGLFPLQLAADRARLLALFLGQGNRRPVDFLR